LRQRSNKDPIAGELGAAQAEIMNLIWDTQGATVPEIHAGINEQRKTGVAYTTVLTLVQRLFARTCSCASPRGARSAIEPPRAATSSWQPGPTR